MNRLVNANCQVGGVYVIKSELKDCFARFVDLNAHFEQTIGANAAPWIKAKGTQFDSAVFGLFEKASLRDELERASQSLEVGKNLVVDSAREVYRLRRACIDDQDWSHGQFVRRGFV